MNRRGFLKSCGCLLVASFSANMLKPKTRSFNKICRKKDLRQQAQADARSVIKIVGIGWYGNFVLQKMLERGIKNVEPLFIDTDNHNLSEHNHFGRCLLIGARTARGKSTNGKHVLGKAAAIEDTLRINSHIISADKLIIVAGLGGGTGGGAAPVIVGEAAKSGIFTVGIVSTPLKYEGCKRFDRAQQSLIKMSGRVNEMISFSLENMFEENREITLLDGFNRIDDDIFHAVNEIVSS